MLQVDEHGFNDAFDKTLTERLAVILASLSFNINGDTSKLDWDDFHGPLFRARAVQLMDELAKTHEIVQKEDLRCVKNLLLSICNVGEIGGQITERHLHEWTEDAWPYIKKLGSML